MRRFGLPGVAGLARRPGARPLLDHLRERIAQQRSGAALAVGGDADPDAGRETLRLLPGVAVDRDLAYGGDPAQRLDVYRPTSAGAGAAPVILFVHGGGWRHGDKALRRMVENKVAHWVGRGCVLLSVNYRLWPAADPLAQADDVARALAFAQGRAARWGGDPARFVAMGHSAGAHLVALVTADPGLAARHGARPWLATVAIDSAALDIEAIMERQHHRLYDPVFGPDPAFWRAASPLHRLVGAPAAPMLLVCASGRHDSALAAHALAAKAARFGGRATVLRIALGHMQLNDLLGVQGDYTEAVDAFLRTVGFE